MIIADMKAPGASGGTFASLLNMLDAPTSDLKASLHPYSLDPPTSDKGPDGPDDYWIRYCQPLETWTSPSIFQTTDNRIVRRSNALLGYGACSTNA